MPIPSPAVPPDPPTPGPLAPDPRPPGAAARAAGAGAPLRAAVAMLVAVALFALMDAGLKTLSLQYSAFQVAFLRGASSLPFVLAWALLTVGARPLLRVRWGLHLLRGGLGVGMMVAFVYAIRTLPLSTAYAIFFVAPLLITALSVPLLGERVGPRRWGAIVVGMTGVLVVLRPTGEGVLTVAGLAVLLAALAYAVSAISVRILGRTDSTQAMMVWLLVFMSLGAGALALTAWTPIQPAHYWIILGVGVVGAVAQYAITEAFRLGEASMIAPIEYTALLWGVILDATLWGVLPDAVTWAGAAIIVASGLYLIRRERLRSDVDVP